MLEQLLEKTTKAKLKIIFHATSYERVVTERVEALIDKKSKNKLKSGEELITNILEKIMKEYKYNLDSQFIKECLITKTLDTEGKIKREKRSFLVETLETIDEALKTSLPLAAMNGNPSLSSP